MRNNLPSNYGRRFLTASEFVELCKNLDIKDISLDRLEWLEKKKLLFPKCRILINPEYAIYFYNTYRNPEHPNFGKTTFELPDEWVEEHCFLERVQNWISIWGYYEFFHPLDKNKFQNRIFDPSVSEFKQWEKYKVNAGQIHGYEHSADTAIHLYSSWQVFQSYEVLKASKINLIIDASDKEIVQSFWQRNISIDKVVAMTLPFLYDSEKSIFFTFKNEFNALSFYTQYYERLGSILIFLWTDEKDGVRKTSIIARARYHRYVKMLAPFTIKRFGLEKEMLYSLLKILCNKYFDYEEWKENKLQNAIKREIYNLTYLIADGYKIEVDDVINNIGKDSSHFKNSLEVIFPDIEKEAKNEAKGTIKSYLANDTELKNYLKLNEEEIDKYLLFLQKNGFGELYYAISEINKDWLSTNSQARSKLVAYIKNLSLLPESIIKYIGRRSSNLLIKNEFDKHKEFKKGLKVFFKDEEWFESLSKKWNEITIVKPETNIEEVINKTILVEAYHQSISGDFIIKAFLITGLTRNAAAHDMNKLINLDNSVYIVILKNIIYANILIWLKSMNGTTISQ